jgi:Fe2+ transport system protein FeoA
MKLPLTSLKNGETGIITSTDINSKGNTMCRHQRRKGWKKEFTTERCIKRLTDLGLTPGSEITVIQAAPFNGPLEITVRGSRLAIGRGMANKIYVDVDR